jgi:hypothetical protein
MSALTNWYVEISKGEKKMSTTFAIQTLIELAIAILLVYGFMHEEKVIAFEQNVKRIVVGNIRRIIRVRNERKKEEIL